MTIEAVNIAARGLQASERRASDLAQRIVENSAKGINTSAFREETRAARVEDAPADVAAELGLNPGRGVPAGNADAASEQPGVPFGSLVADITGLIAEEAVFRANAAVFKRAAETTEELGRLLDRET